MINMQLLDGEESHGFISINLDSSLELHFHWSVGIRISLPGATYVRDAVTRDYGQLQFLSPQLAMQAEVHARLQCYTNLVFWQMYIYHTETKQQVSQVSMYKCVHLPSRAMEYYLDPVRAYCDPPVQLLAIIISRQLSGPVSQEPQEILMEPQLSYWLPFAHL